jgi:RNA polymerase sigma-70 factor, ECF subfamily
MQELRRPFSVNAIARVGSNQTNEQQQGHDLMTSFKDDLVSLIPHLRAFARTLSGYDATLADDLVQDTLAKALQAQDRFQPGTNLKAWLFTIMHNHFRSLGRSKRSKGEVPLDDVAAKLWTAPRQENRLEMVALRRAMAHLSAAQREVVILVCAEGCTYEQAAKICRCEVGTVRSRLNRARNALKDMLLEGQLPSVPPENAEQLAEAARSATGPRFGELDDVAPRSEPKASRPGLERRALN